MQTTKLIKKALVRSAKLRIKLFKRKKKRKQREIEPDGDTVAIRNTEYVQAAIVSEIQNDDAVSLAAEHTQRESQL